MFTFLRAEKDGFNARRSLFAVLVIMGLSFLISMFIPEGSEDLGPISLLPAIFLIVYIFITKRILEALTLASVMGFIMVARGDVMGAFSSTLLDTMISEDIAWLIIVCGLMGSIISLIERAGGAFAFGEYVSTKAKTRKSALMWTWVLGLVIFIDDYLNSLTVGSCMAPLTDRHKVPREFLAYVVDSTAAPLCVLVPLTTWSVFASRLFEFNGWAPEGEGLIYFVKTIPYNFYAWTAALIVPLIIMGVIPIFGPMKKAEERVLLGGPLAPEGSERIDIRGATEDMILPKNPRMINFFVPIIVLIVSTIYFDIDMQMGVITTVAVMFVMYMGQNLMSAMEFSDVALQGLKNMIFPLLLMVLAFLFAAVNDQIGFTYYVITSTTSVLTPALMPLIIFGVLAFTEFITGTNWGMYVIAFPIVLPIAMELNANVPLVAAAVLSAGVFGSHICFYSDATVLTSAACGCDNFRHAITQAPFGILAAVISAVMFLIAGLLFG